MNPVSYLCTVNFTSINEYKRGKRSIRRYRVILVQIFDMRLISNLECLLVLPLSTGMFTIMLCILVFASVAVKFKSFM